VIIFYTARLPTRQVTPSKLRGLSDDGTIVLVNGRRLALSGTVGAFTDVGNLPLAAIDHMEVIPEGTTALYGVDAVGGIGDGGGNRNATIGGLGCPSAIGARSLR
jgi:outer membrane receptor for ferrienterochelin and colicin